MLATELSHLVTAHHSEKEQGAVDLSIHAHSSSLRPFSMWPEVINSTFLLFQPLFHRLDEKRRFFNPGKMAAVLEHHQA
jgi:hypothetical protein